MTTEDYMENGMPVLETRPADYVAEGSSGVVITSSSDNRGAPGCAVSPGSAPARPGGYSPSSR